MVEQGKIQKEVYERAAWAAFSEHYCDKENT